jgi:CheY-like chemotaxis protein
MTDTPRAPKTFGEILQQNQDFITHLQALQEDVQSQLAKREAELAQAAERLAEVQKDLDELTSAQLRWAMDRQALLAEHETLKKGHEALKTSNAAMLSEHATLKKGHEALKSSHGAMLSEHETLKKGHEVLKTSSTATQAELIRVQQEVQLAKTRDDERRAQLRQLEKERIELSQKAETDQRKLREQQAALSKDLESLQTDQLQWAVDREGLLKERDGLSQRHTKVTAQLADLTRQVQLLTTEIEPLRAARDKWQVERQRLIADLGRLEQETQAKDAQVKSDRKLLQAELDDARKQLKDTTRLQQERQQLADEKAALLAKVRSLEGDWQSREGSIAEEKGKLKQQMQEAQARVAAVQQDYDKLKALHQDLAGESGKKAEEWTVREHRLTAEKNQLKVDLERVQAELSAMSDRHTELQKGLKSQNTELEVAWHSEKASLKAQLDEARKAASQGPTQVQLITKFEGEKRALQAQLDAIRTELTAAGKGKEAAAALAQAKRDFEAKFRVIYDQSHDLKSPLNAINGFSNILLNPKENQTTPEERQEFISHIYEAGRLLHEHINELIEFAKQEAGIQEKPVAMIPPAPSGGTKAPIILVADNDGAVKDRIEPFLSNAGYEVLFAASSQEALKKAVQAQPLAILIDAALPPNGGSGLIYDLRRESKTRDIPVVLTSKVNKESLGFDIGHSDFLTKPIDRQQLLQMMVKYDLLADGKRSKKTPSSILVVDDDPQNVRLLKAMLKPFNMEVLVADGGKSGIEQALKKKPDLIILDLMMPEVDGFEVVSALRGNPDTAEIPILIYTAKNITSEDRERLQGNIQSIIQKGDFGKERFLEMINSLQTTPPS